MMPRGLFENRYLRFYKGGVQVRIVRLSINYSRKFKFRSHGGKDLAIEKARRHRDRAYREIFGVALTESSHLLQPRSGSAYPVGVSPVLNEQGGVIAFISSWQDQKGGTIREYTPIKDNQIDRALNEAISKRINGITDIDNETQNP